MLILCTARLELLERRPAWAGGKLNAANVALAPLSADETAKLIAALSDRPLLEAGAQAELLDRAGGNPLYAEQYVRMLAERGTTVDLPESVQGIIAARLDGLPPEEKAALQDAAVLGKVFWLGALGVSEERLHALQQKEFVQRARRSSVAGETEFAFKHVLVRDVAYGQIPRAERAQKHARAAEWIESLGRPEDHAEMVAHHYASALELARAAGQDVDDLARPHAGCIARCRRARADAERARAGGGLFPPSARTHRGGRPRTAPPAIAVRPSPLLRELEGVDELTEARESLVRSRRPRWSRRSVADAGRHRVAGRQSRRDAARARGRSASRRRRRRVPAPRSRCSPRWRATRCWPIGWTRRSSSAARPSRSPRSSAWRISARTR